MARAPLAASAVVALILSGCAEEKRTTPVPVAVKECPRLMYGITCKGGDLDVGEHVVEDLAACCDLCSSTKHCKAFTYRNYTGTCFLKKRCRHLHLDEEVWGFVSATLPGRLDVQRGLAKVDGYKCTDRPDTMLFYPDKKGSYPVIIYGHGTWGEVDGLDDWMEAIAAQGFVVVAPFSGLRATPCHADSAHDMVHAAEQLKIHGAKLHPSLAMVDWRRLGLFGHSRGAHYVPLAASMMSRSKQNLTLAAMILSHGAPDAPMRMPNPAVPAMFTTGTMDYHDNENHHDYDFFLKYASESKIYVNIVGGWHMEPRDTGLLNNLTAVFFSCFVRRSEAACDVIYGKRPGNLCQAEGVEYESCLAVRDGKTLRNISGNASGALFV